MTIVVSTCYFPPVNWFALLAGEYNVCIEKHENFKKQTYRNRCEILSANGKLALSIPVVKNHNVKTPVTEVKIDYSAPWQRIHLQSIRSSYGKTPYFIHYFDDIKEIIECGEQNLWDLNKKSIEFFTSVLEINYPAETNEFLKSYPAGCDFRDAVHPKKNIINTEFKPYIQAYSDKFAFVPGLSVLDLLFNMGPDSRTYIKK